jgi:hypothetical protein
MTAALAPQTLINGTLADCANAITASYERLRDAVSNAGELLVLSGNAGMRGDTADDLVNAMAVHGHLLQQFQVKVRTDGHVAVYTAAADSSYSAYADAADSQGDAPCAITVTPASASTPDRATLAAAHRQLRIAAPLDDALKNPALSLALHSFARKHPLRPAPSSDFKRNAANDRD